MVPNGWEVKKLNELCEINPKKPSKPNDELVSFISMSQVSEDGQIISTETKTYDEVSKGFTSFKDKDVLVAKITPCFENGKGALAHTLINGIGFGSTEFHVLRAKETTDPKFIYYITRTNAFRAKGTMNMQGSAGHRRVTTDFIQVYKINTPPLLEQQKIAKILSTWDKAISTTERLIDKSAQQKKALMQQLLTGKKRLLDETGKRFAGEWEEYKLGDITDFIRDGTHGTHERYESGVPMLSAKNITKQNTVDFDDAPYISEEDYNKIHARYTIKSGDILLTVVGTLGRVALVPEELAEKFTLQRSVAIIRVAKGVCNQFLMQLFSSSDFTHLLHRKSNSTAQAGVYLGELGKLKILLPSFEEQQKIATVLTNADKEIELLKQQLADLQQEKKALMQQLLTGKKRVVVDE
ncbi:restriction endonuclease subunit S [Psychrobacter okhotskensis]|uniref:restriction endonuclease subunit S n=1 Tax=Psychrobacter okhotskensis TaxID=212403 RepID=UPI00191913AF|nr:restriction endonuclease subunit S [Psychrobacter okhotskensis]